MMAMIYYDKRLHAGIITDHNNHKDPRATFFVSKESMRHGTGNTDYHDGHDLL